jgi:ribonuclease Z
LLPKQCYTFPDGSILTAEDVVEPVIEGRKVVIMGDTCNSDMIANIAQNASVIVHESTNAWDNGDKSKFGNYHNMEYDTFSHGHSTPQMAGRFARKVGAKKLILTHFSPRYRGDASDSSMRIMWQLEDMAKVGSDFFWGHNDVIAAWDQMSVYVNR